MAGHSRVMRQVWLTLAAVWIVSLLPPVAIAQDPPPPVKAIDVRGNKRIDESTIRSRLTLAVNDPVSPETLRDQIRLLYDMGFFEDVQVETEPVLGGVAIIVSVREKPFITEVVFDGNENLSDDKLQEAITIRSQSFLSQQLAKESAEKIEEAYQEEGYYRAKVIPIIQSIDEDRKRLTLFIKEGKRTKIKTINFIGAEHVEKSELLEFMANREYMIGLSWFTDRGVLRREELSNDVERIKEVFMNHGYLNVRVSQPTVDLTSDKDWLTVTFQIIEGEPYTFTPPRFQGHAVFSDAELRQGTLIIANEVFQRGLLREEVTRITDLYGEEGYAFADVAPSITTDDVNRTATVTINIKEGSLIRIRRINITGNDKTRDNVIRRELRVQEQQVIDTVAMKRSFQRLNNLNYFETVEILPNQVAPDKVDLEVKVKEKPTGAFSVGGGFSTLDQLVAIANITEGNLFGRGYTGRIRGQLGQRRTLGLISFRDPNFRDSTTSVQLDGFKTRTDFQTYIEDKTGGSLTLGRFFSEYLSGSFSFFGEQLDIENPSLDAPEFILQQVGSQSSTGFRSTLTRDTRDYFLDPRSGWRHSIGLDYATKLLGGTNHFYKVRLDSLKYTPLWFDFRHMIRGRFGVVEGIGDNPTPVPERLFVGGINTMRGFTFGRAGPVTPSNTPEGGEQEIIINNDLIIPISSEIKLNGVLFFDYGEGYNSRKDINLLDLRRSAGVEVRWISPFGPLRAAYGYNLDRRPGEKKAVFEFSVGNLF